MSLPTGRKRIVPVAVPFTDLAVPTVGNDIAALVDRNFTRALYCLSLCRMVRGITLIPFATDGP